MVGRHYTLFGKINFDLPTTYALELGEKKRFRYPVGEVGLKSIAQPQVIFLRMKCRACRAALPGYRGDLDDLTFLIKKMEIKSIAQADEHVERHFPRYELDDVKQAVIASLIKKVWG